MSRTVRSILTFATVSLNTASSAFAHDLGQSSVACYGQVVDGYDETIFPQLRPGLFRPTRRMNGTDRPPSQTSVPARSFSRRTGPFFLSVPSFPSPAKRVWLIASCKALFRPSF